MARLKEMTVRQRKGKIYVRVSMVSGIQVEEKECKDREQADKAIKVMREKYWKDLISDEPWVFRRRD